MSLPRFIGGLNFKINEELGENGHLGTDTNKKIKMMAMFRQQHYVYINTRILKLMGQSVSQTSMTH